MRSLVFAFSCLFFFSSLLGLESGGKSALFDSPLRKIVGKKQELYYSEGLFFKEGKSSSSVVVNKIRQFYSPQQKQERLVIEFLGDVPQTYLALNPKNQKLFVDFFGARVDPLKTAPFGKGHFVKNLYFYSLGKDILTLEIGGVEALSFEIFTLEKPGRLVIDMRP